MDSGDSACVIPTFSLSQKVLSEISSATKAMARELNVRGLMNVQFAVKGEDVYVLEVNPRASRTVPFVSKAIGVPLAKLAAKVSKLFATTLFAASRGSIEIASTREFRCRAVRPNSPDVSALATFL